MEKWPWLDDLSGRGVKPGTRSSEMFLKAGPVCALYGINRNLNLNLNSAGAWWRVDAFLASAYCALLWVKHLLSSGTSQPLNSKSRTINSG